MSDTPLNTSFFFGRDLLPQQAPVLRDGGVMELAVEQLVPGDVMLKAG